MPRSLIVRVIVPAAAALSLLGQPAWAGGSGCWNPDEIPAAQLHAFHTSLMVGALRCRSERPDALSSYEAFAHARKSSIDAARTVLQARFIRELGAETGLTEFKNFDTEMANRASMDGPDAMPCDGVDTYSRLALSASQADLYTLARLNNSGLETRSCAMKPSLALADPALKTASGGMPDQAGPVQVVTARAVATSETPDAAAARITVGAQPADATEPEMQPASQTLETAAATLPPESGSGEAAVPNGNANADPAKALEEAARALAAAATSLRTASSASN